MNLLQNKQQYQLIWSDEFNQDGMLDTSKWRMEQGFVRNREDQWYQSENAKCENGYLVITGKKDIKPNPNYVQDSKDWKTNRQNIQYTSASVVMKKQHAFQYGRLEVRARIDAQPGLWPAIWTLGIDGEWPSNGEVDIMEYYDDMILANYAHSDQGRWKAIWNSVKKPLSSFNDEEWAKKFHVWVLEWDYNKMNIFVDDLLLNSIDLNTTFNKSDGKNPFRQPHYVLLNLALGGQRGGNLSTTKLPSDYLIDYVRIYQK